MRTIKIVLIILAFLLIIVSSTFTARFEKCEYPQLLDSSVNLATSTNGARVIFYSSEYAPGWEAKKLIDGDYLKGWGTKSEKAAGEWVEIILPVSEPEIIKQIRINPGPTIGNVSSWGLKDFHVDVSTDEAMYRTVLKDSFSPVELNKTKSFNINPVSARFIRITIDSNQDSTVSQYADVAEIEVYSCSLRRSIERYFEKKYPKISSIINGFSENISHLIRSVTGKNRARKKLPVTSVPKIGDYFRLSQETIIRANNALRYPSYPKSLAHETVVKIVDGPRYFDGYEWWKLSEEEWGGYTGWFAFKEM